VVGLSFLRIFYLRGEVGPLAVDVRCSHFVRAEGRSFPTANTRVAGGIGFLASVGCILVLFFLFGAWVLFLFFLMWDVFGFNRFGFVSGSTSRLAFGGGERNCPAFSCD